MLVHPSEKIPIARLLTFLEHGERLANECAKAQAPSALEPDRVAFSSAKRGKNAHTRSCFKVPLPGWPRGISAMYRFCPRLKNTARSLRGIGSAGSD